MSPEIANGCTVCMGGVIKTWVFPLIFFSGIPLKIFPVQINEKLLEKIISFFASYFLYQRPNNFDLLLLETLKFGLQSRILPTVGQSVDMVGFKKIDVKQETSRGDRCFNKNWKMFTVINYLQVRTSSFIHCWVKLKLKKDWAILNEMEEM